MLGLFWLVLSPDNSVGARAVSGVSQVAEAAGLPEVLTYRHVWEFVLNVALFAVLVFLTYLLWPGLGVLGWTALTATLSGGLELIQVFLPERTASINDILANTLGGLLGATAAAIVVATLASRRSAPERAHAA